MSWSRRVLRRTRYVVFVHCRSRFIRRRRSIARVGTRSRRHSTLGRSRFGGGTVVPGRRLRYVPVRWSRWLVRTLRVVASRRLVCRRIGRRRTRNVVRACRFSVASRLVARGGRRTRNIVRTSGVRVIGSPRAGCVFRRRIVVRTTVIRRRCSRSIRTAGVGRACRTALCGSRMEGRSGFALRLGCV